MVEKNCKILKSKDLKVKREELLKLQQGLCKLTNLPSLNFVLDHDHKDGHIRGVLDREVNQFLGKLESNYIRFIKWKFPNLSLQQLLYNIILYLNQDYSNNEYHPNYVNKMLRKFSNLKSELQKKVLEEVNVVPENSKVLRLKQYRKIINNVV